MEPETHIPETNRYDSSRLANFESLDRTLDEHQVAGVLVETANQTFSVDTIFSRADAVEYIGSNYHGKATDGEEWFATFNYRVKSHPDEPVVSVAIPWGPHEGEERKQIGIYTDKDVDPSVIDDVLGELGTAYALCIAKDSSSKVALFDPDFSTVEGPYRVLTQAAKNMAIENRTRFEDVDPDWKVLEGH